MDHVPNPLLRPPAELSDHFHCVGYRWTEGGYTGGWHHVPFVWKEVVRIPLNLGLSVQFICIPGRYDGASTA